MHARLDSHSMHDLTVTDHDYIKYKPASEQQNNVCFQKEARGSLWSTTVIHH